MADISVIKLPSGSQYNIKDTWARQQLESFTGGSALVFVGVTTSALEDGSTTSPIIVDNQSVVPQTGNVVFYTPTGEPTQEFIWNGTSWQLFGAAADILGDLAYKDSASGTFTPSGSVSAPSFTGSQSSVTITAADNANGNYQPKGSISGITWTGTSMTSTGAYTPAGSITFSNGNKTTTVSAAESGAATYTPSGTVGTPTISVKTAGSTTTIKNPTSKTVVTDMSVAEPSATAATGALIYYSVSGETLTLKQIVETTGASISTSNVTVKNGDAAYESTQPTWTGTGVRLVTGNISVPTSASFNGTEATISVNGTTAGSISNQGTFTGTKTQLNGTTIAAGSVGQPTFTGSSGTVTVS